MGRREKEQQSALTQKVAIGVFLGLGLFVAVCAVVFVMYRQHQKRTMYQQRLVFEEWDSARLDVWANDQFISLENIMSPDKAKLAKFESDKKAAKTRQQAAEEESFRRWGRPPSDFSGYPGSLNRYYQEWP